MIKLDWDTLLVLAQSRAYVADMAAYAVTEDFREFSKELLARIDALLAGSAHAQPVMEARP